MQTKKMKDKDTLKWIIGSVKNQFPAVFLLIISNAVLSFLGVDFAFKCSTVIDAANTFDKKGLISGLLFLLQEYVIGDAVHFVMITPENT